MRDQVSRDFLTRLLDAPKGLILSLCVVMAVIIASLDAFVHTDVSVGIAFAIPLMLAAPYLNRPVFFLLALGFAMLREHSTPDSWDANSGPRVFYAFLTFAGVGLFFSELMRNRRQALTHNAEMAEQVKRREEAERKLRTLIESSPAAIITLDSGGRIEMANLASHEMLAVAPGELRGRSIREFLPVMSDLLERDGGGRPYRTATNCKGRRANGQSFLACVWFATYATEEGPTLAAIITDASDDLRDWQETSLESLLRSTRVLVGSVSHEIRNVCAAISVVHANLGRISGVSETEDYVALGTLSAGLARLATVELNTSGDAEFATADLRQLLEEFRIVVGPGLEESNTELHLALEEDLPHVQGDNHGLLQVLLNLSRNSLRAMENSDNRQIRIIASKSGSDVVVRFTDSGPGVARPERLFQPFQQGADAVGLGLFVSRAIVRACGGELYHEAGPSGCTMCLRLKSAPHPEVADTHSTEVHA